MYIAAAPSFFVPNPSYPSQPTIKMCCWPFVDVQLEEAPKEEKKEYVLVSDQLVLHPGVSQSFFFLAPFIFSLRAFTASHI